MNTTIKTYPDGSQITTAHVAAFVPLAIITMSIGTIGAIKVADWKSARAAKKAGIKPNNLKTL